MRFIMLLFYPIVICPDYHFALLQLHCGKWHCLLHCVCIYYFNMSEINTHLSRIRQPNLEYEGFHYHYNKSYENTMWADILNRIKIINYITITCTNFNKRLLFNNCVIVCSIILLLSYNYSCWRIYRNLYLIHYIVL